MAKLEIQDQEVAVVPGESAVPQTALEAFNPEFSGLGLKDWPDRVVIDGESFLYKNEERTVKDLSIVFKAGKNLWQHFDKEANTFFRSFDNKVTLDGEPVSKYPKMRHMYQLTWVEDREGEEKELELLLSPTGRYKFVEYAEALKKLGKPITSVTTIITIGRTANADGERYSVPLFNCAELAATGFAQSASKK